MTRTMVDTLRLGYCYLEAQMLLDPINCGRMAFGLRVTCCRHMKENQCILMSQGRGRRSGPAWCKHWHLSWVSWIRLQSGELVQSNILFVGFQLLSCVLFCDPVDCTRSGGMEAPLSSSASWSLLKFMSTEPVVLFNHLILCCPLLLLPSVFPSIRVL